MGNLFLTPNKIIIGKDALQISKLHIKDFGSKALIVTDDMMVRLGNLDRVVDVLKFTGIEYTVYSKVNSEPTDIMVKEGKHIYDQNDCNFLIALGGGSPIDTMKAIGVMITNEGEISDYLGKVIEKDLPKMIAIPTTAGTGSEATQFTIISDVKRDIKMLLSGPGLIPNLAIVDPIFTMTAPPSVTAATGIDALTHAIESFTSRKSQPMSDSFAISAVKRIFENLKIAYIEGSNEEARKEMSIASLEAGIAFNNSSVTIVHGMSRPIGALFHVPHGLSNAMLLESCLEFAKEGCRDKLAYLAKIIGTENLNEEDSANSFVNEVTKLCKDLNIMTLKEFGVNKYEFLENLDKMAEDALESGSPYNTVRIPTKDDIINIYKSLWK
ncbi:MAG: iron-containing alcohol dehydrogenase [Terrisporobacter sp.]|uniref:iron-containing alcohol dehydrogenase n=1 Tax=Terrisporobacter sp. TaxID=1965305 RepID=UPI002FC8506F